MEIKILFLMVLFHIIDDFVLQPVCLSKLKQKDWWKKQEGYNDFYAYDYLMSLLVHSMSWSIMILLPCFNSAMLTNTNLTVVFIMNTGIHFFVDDLKANFHKINLIEDQIIHFIQIMVTWLIFVIL